MAPLSAEDQKDLIALRRDVETIAITRSLRQGGVDWEAGLIAAAHRLRAAHAPRDGRQGIDPAWIEAHRLFHLTLIAGCGSPRLIRLCASLHVQAERYACHRPAHMGRRAGHEAHEELLHLALARRPAPLIARFAAHIRAD